MLIALALAMAVPAAHSNSVYRTDVQAWRQKREDRLRAEQGWLAVSGLFWLKSGRNELPAPYDKAGWFEVDGEKTVAHVGGTAKTLKEDDDGTDVEFGRWIFELHGSGRRRAIRVWDRDNPRRKSYPPLRWFSIDEAYRIQAKYVPFEKPKRILVQNLAGDSEATSINGYAEFSLHRRRIRLEGWEEDSKMFFVFRDKTSGKETYPTARFLLADMPKDGAILLDFNEAYNPPCAFSPFATCPLPPLSNLLPVRVVAGEKMPPERHR